MQKLDYRKLEIKYNQLQIKLSQTFDILGIKKQNEYKCGSPTSSTRHIAAIEEIIQRSPVNNTANDLAKHLYNKSYTNHKKKISKKSLTQTYSVVQPTELEDQDFIRKVKEIKTLHGVDEDMSVAKSGNLQHELFQAGLPDIDTPEDNIKHDTDLSFRPEPTAFGSPGSSVLLRQSDQNPSSEDKKTLEQIQNLSESILHNCRKSMLQIDSLIEIPVVIDNDTNLPSARLPKQMQIPAEMS